MAGAVAGMLKDIALVSTFGKGIVGGIFRCFGTTGAFNEGQTPVLKEMVGKGQSVPREEEVERNE